MRDRERKMITVEKRDLLRGVTSYHESLKEVFVRRKLTATGLQTVFECVVLWRRWL